MTDGTVSLTGGGGGGSRDVGIRGAGTLTISDNLMTLDDARVYDGYSGVLSFAGAVDVQDNLEVHDGTLQTSAAVSAADVDITGGTTNVGSPLTVGNYMNITGGDVNLFRATDTACSRSYLLDKAVGEARLAETVLNSVGSIEDFSFRMRLANLGEPDLGGAGFCFIADIATAGKDNLVASILIDGEPVVSSAPVAIDLRHVKTFYQRTTMDWPEDLRPPWEYTTEAPPDPGR